MREPVKNLKPTTVKNPNYSQVHITNITRQNRMEVIGIMSIGLKYKIHKATRNRKVAICGDFNCH